MSSVQSVVNSGLPTMPRPGILNALSNRDASCLKKSRFGNKQIAPLHFFDLRGLPDHVLPINPWMWVFVCVPGPPRDRSLPLGGLQIKGLNPEFLTVMTKKPSRQKGFRRYPLGQSELTQESRSVEKWKLSRVGPIWPTFFKCAYRTENRFRAYRPQCMSQSVCVRKPGPSARVR